MKFKLKLGVWIYLLSMIIMCSAVDCLKMLNLLSARI